MLLTLVGASMYFDDEKKAAKEAYWYVANRLAFDETVDEEEVIDALKAYDKTPEQMDALVSKIKSRNQWFETMKAADDYAADIKRIDQQIADADAERDAALEKHAKTVLPLIEEKNAWQPKLEEARQAKRRLHETCNDSELQSELKSTNQRRSEASREKEQLSDAIQNRSHRVNELKRFIAEAEADRRPTDNLKDELSAVEESLATHKERYHALSAEIRLLDGNVEVLHQHMLNPVACE